MQCFHRQALYLWTSQLQVQWIRRTFSGQTTCGLIREVNGCRSYVGVHCTNIWEPSVVCLFHMKAGDGHTNRQIGDRWSWNVGRHSGRRTIKKKGNNSTKLEQVKQRGLWAPQYMLLCGYLGNDVIFLRTLKNDRTREKSYNMQEAFLV